VGGGDRRRPFAGLSGRSPLLYNVQAMKAFKVAEARVQFGELLDRAESGDPVFIERRGVRFSLRAERAQAAPTPEPPFAHVDEAVLRGEWDWALRKDGVAFRPRRTRR
jgi:hypothetical protein